MAIYAECPSCRKKQSNRNKKCKCGEDLVKAKRSERVNYWISYYLPSGKNRRELIGKKLSYAQAAEGKRKAQKKENPRVLKMAPTEKTTFNHLAEWYLNLKTVSKLKSYSRVKGCLKNFGNVLGGQGIYTVTLEDLENYQAHREKQGRSPATIDMEIKYAQAVITKAFYNNKVDADPLKAFKQVERKLSKGSNARKRIMTTKEYLQLLSVAPIHLKNMITVAMNTGMRLGEIRLLQWSRIDREGRFIRLTEADTKEKKEKNIPINNEVQAILNSIVRHIDHDLVFTFRGKPIKERDGLKRSFATACRISGIPCGRKVKDGVTFHDIRRTVKTNMVNAEVDKIYRDVILGHSLHGMDAFYIAPEDDSLKAAMAKYSKWFSDQIVTELENSDQNSDQEVNSK